MSMVSKFVLWSVVLLVLVGLTGVKAVWNNQNVGTHDFNYWQDQYKTVAYKLSDDPSVKAAIQATANEVKQVTVLQFAMGQPDGTTQQRVDRCESCHVGLEDPNMTAEKIIKAHDGATVSAAQVADYLDQHVETRELVEAIGAHPGVAVDTAPRRNLGVVHSAALQYGVATETSPTPEDQADYSIQMVNLKKHPFPTFGCTTCHGGSGRELIERKAHGFPDNKPGETATGDDVHWLQPLLAAKYMDAECAQCHSQYDPKTFHITYLPSMKTIARGEKLFIDKACYGCHKIEGFSKGNIGPELTNEGRSAIPSTIEHQLWDPKYKVPGCIMPYFFSTRLFDPAGPTYKADPRIQVPQAAEIDNPPTDFTEAITSSLKDHGYVPNKDSQADVDALVTFIYSQTGQNYADSQAQRITEVAAYNVSTPPQVPATATEGKILFDSSGCYSCHFVGSPTDPKKGHGGFAGPELTWEGSRHSQEWLIGHYKNPQEFVPGSIMPIFPLSNSERAALAAYDLTFKSANNHSGPVSPEQDLPPRAAAMAGVRNSQIRYMTR